MARPRQARSSSATASRGARSRSRFRAYGRREYLSSGPQPMAGIGPRPSWSWRTCSPTCAGGFGSPGAGARARVGADVPRVRERVDGGEAPRAAGAERGGLRMGADPSLAAVLRRSPLGCDHDSGGRPLQDGEAQEGRLSPGTLNKTLTRLAQVLEQAVEYGHLPSNPAAGKRRRVKATAPRRSWLEPEQVAPLVAAAGVRGQRGGKTSPDPRTRARSRLLCARA